VVREEAGPGEPERHDRERRLPGAAEAAQEHALPLDGCAGGVEQREAARPAESPAEREIDEEVGEVLQHDLALLEPEEPASEPPERAMRIAMASPDEEPIAVAPRDHLEPRHLERVLPDDSVTRAGESIAERLAVGARLLARRPCRLGSSERDRHVRGR